MQSWTEIGMSSRSPSPPRAGTPLDLWDMLSLGALLLVGFCLMALRYDSLPLLFWDESRAANNALEMVRSGHWLVPSYGGVPDHWQTKPPLLIWQISVLMRLGLPPLLAVRLPTMLAALATVGVVWGVCRYALRDRAAATVSGFLLLLSLFYTKIHIARTGDYDALLTFFTLCYVLAFWKSIERAGTVRISWFAVSAAGLVLAVMTKGVAGTFALAGLFVFSLISGRLVILFGNVRVWLLALLALSLCLAYYGSREQYDPGYLQAVSQNELAASLTSVDGHAGSPLFYIICLGVFFEPGVVLLPLVALTIFGTDKRQCSLAALCLSCAASILVIITTAQTKVAHYAAPILPFLAIAAALGVSDGLRWIKAHASQMPAPFRVTPLQIALGVVLGLTSAVTLYRNQVVDLRWVQQASNGQLWYGALFEELQAQRNVAQLVILDTGVEALARNEILGNYSPVLKFYAEIARTKGLVVSVAGFDTPISAGGLAATCDPTLVPLLAHQEGFMVGGWRHSCVFGVTARSLEVPALRRSGSVLGDRPRRGWSADVVEG
jgi:4-amino-4-deoxy-L-arabinose transferase-like glycosyltransferase